MAPTNPLVVRELNVGDLIPTPNNPREIDEKAQKFLELVASVKASGVLRPGDARPHPTLPGKWDLLCGARRHRACLVAGLLTMPCMVHDPCSGQRAFEITFAENFQREDLQPLEEGQAVKIFLAHFGGDHKTVADKLGVTVQWVATRERLGQLSVAWRKAVRNEKMPFLGWEASHLALIARLDGDVQDLALERLTENIADGDVFAWGAALRPGALAKWLNDEFLHLLSGAPWKLDDAALNPAAGACEDCLRRSSCEASLFGDPAFAEDKAKKNDRCLDTACWRLKNTALLCRRYARLKAEHPGLRVLRGKGDSVCPEYQRQEEVLGLKDRFVRYAGEYDRAEAGGKGAFPALVLDGKGGWQLAWFKNRIFGKPGGGSRGSSGAHEPAPPKPLCQRREELAARRVRLAARNLLAEAKRCRQDLVVAFAVVFGTEHNAGNPYWGEKDKPWETLAEQLQAPPQALYAALWAEVWRVLDRRLMQSLECEPKRLADEAQLLAKAIGLDWTRYLGEATAEIPDPASWKRLNPDGTPKSAAAPKKRAPSSPQPD